MYINRYTPPQCAAEFAQSQSPRTRLGKFLKSQLTTINPIYHGYTAESGDFLLPSSRIQNPTDTAGYTFSKISSHAILCRKLSTGWRRLVGSLIFISHFLQKSPIIRIQNPLLNPKHNTNGHGRVNILKNQLYRHILFCKRAL